MEKLMNMKDVVEGWQEMEGNEVIWVVGKACENGARGHRSRVCEKTVHLNKQMEVSCI